MVQFLKKHNKAVVVLLAGVTMIATISQGNPRRHSNRHVYVRGGVVMRGGQTYAKVYALLPPYGMSKSMQQMQGEAVEGRQHFSKLFQGTGPEPSKNLLSIMTPVKDQAHRGTCVAFASTALVEAEVKSAKGQAVDLSEQFIYWASKAIEKVDPNADGSEPIAMLQTFDKVGAPAERAWPYDPNPWFADKVHHKDCFDAYKANPDDVPTQCVTNGDAPAQAKSAPKVGVTGEQKVGSSPEAIVGFLENGIPVEVGMDVYQHAWSFDNPNSANFKAGVITMPESGDKVIGGHAVLIVGYDKNAKVYLFKNSWGTDDWSSKSKFPGYGVIPMDYIRKYGEAVVAKIKM